MHTVLVKSAHVCTHMAEQKGYGFLASPFVFSASFAFSSSPYILLHIFHEKKKKKEQRTDTTICFNFITVLLFSIIKTRSSIPSKILQYEFNSFPSSFFEQCILLFERVYYACKKFQLPMDRYHY